jgi:hypothetical protein
VLFERAGMGGMSGDEISRAAEEGGSGERSATEGSGREDGSEEREEESTCCR